MNKVLAHQRDLGQLILKVLRLYDRQRSLETKIPSDTSDTWLQLALKIYQIRTENVLHLDHPGNMMAHNILNAFGALQQDIKEFCEARQSYQKERDKDRK